MILEILGDGKWHGLLELQQKVKLTALQMREIMAFLEQYEFVQTNPTNRKVKITQNAKIFLSQAAT